MSEWSKGAEHARDNICALILGIQNNMTCIESPEYDALQKLLVEIEDRYGAMFMPWKG